MLRFECGNYIFIVSVAKLSSKIVDSRLGCHKKRVKARILSEAEKEEERGDPKRMLKKESFELRVIRFHASITRVCALVMRISWSILE